MKQNGKGKRHLFALSVILGAVIAIAACAAIFVMKSYHGEKQWIYIPSDATAQSVRDSLETHLGAVGIDIYLIWRVMGGDTSAAHGAYLVSDGDVALQVSRRIAQGRQTPVRITVNNVRTVRQLAQRVSAGMEWIGDDFIAACNKVLPDAGFKTSEYPAAFIPDTYEFYWTSSTETVVKKLLDYRNAFWNDERRAKAKKLGLTPVKTATLASIVEEETNAADERPVVARLYLNRLDRGMKLQADPTVKFAVGDFSIRRITGKHLAEQSPYNTYLNAGLPPGPIRVAEKSAIDAVLDAPQHGYIYMCAKEDFSGRHNFASDYATHQRNATRYRTELNRRNIK